MSALASELTRHKQLAWGKQPSLKSLEHPGHSQESHNSTKTPPLHSKISSESIFSPHNRPHTTASQAPFSKIILSTIEKEPFKEGSIPVTGNVEIARLRALVPKPLEGVLSACRGSPKTRLSQISYKKRAKLIFPQATNIASSQKRFINDFDEATAESKISLSRPPFGQFNKQQNSLYVVDSYINPANNNERIPPAVQITADKRWQISKIDLGPENSSPKIKKAQNRVVEKVGSFAKATNKPGNLPSQEIIKTSPSSALLVSLSSLPSNSSNLFAPSSLLSTHQKSSSSSLSDNRPHYSKLQKDRNLPRKQQLLVVRNPQKSPIPLSHVQLKPKGSDVAVQTRLFDRSTSLTTIDIGSKSVPTQYLVMSDDEKMGFWNSYFRIAGIADEGICSSPPRCAQEL